MWRHGQDANKRPSDYSPSINQISSSRHFSQGCRILLQHLIIMVNLWQCYVVHHVPLTCSHITAWLSDHFLTPFVLFASHHYITVSSVIKCNRTVIILFSWSLNNNLVIIQRTFISPIAPLFIQWYNHHTSISLYNGKLHSKDIQLK